VTNPHELNLTKELFMTKTSVLSKQTRNNWTIDAALFLGALIAMLSGIYFLFLPVGGYQGGRNPLYGVRIIFQRGTWEDLHTWFGILMIFAAAVHITIHWNWIVSMTKRAIQELVQGKRRFNARSRLNVGINVLTGFSFLVTSISGLYLFFFPGGSHGVADPMILFNRVTWELFHTWAGIIMICIGVVHFTIHWGWITKVTKKMFIPFRSGPASEIAENSI
jgi:hypothetical protein